MENFRYKSNRINRERIYNGTVVPFIKQAEEVVVIVFFNLAIKRILF